MLSWPHQKVYIWAEEGPWLCQASPGRSRLIDDTFEVSGTDSHGEEFNESAKTLLVNRRGAMIVLAES